MYAKAQQTNALIAGARPCKPIAGQEPFSCWLSRKGKCILTIKRHLFRMADEHHHYEAGHERVVFEWRGWRILPLVCYDPRFLVHGRATATIMTWRCMSLTGLAPRLLHWQSLLVVRAIENCAYAVGCKPSRNGWQRDITTAATAGW